MIYTALPGQPGQHRQKNLWREDPLIGLRTVQPNAGTSEVANKGHEVHVDDKGYHSPDEATSHAQQDAVVTWREVCV